MVRSPVRLKLTLALPPMVPALLLFISADKTEARRNARRAHVNPSIRSDHSTIGVSDREARVALRGQLAAEIKREIGASTDAATTVVDQRR